MFVCLGPYVRGPLIRAILIESFCRGQYVGVVLSAMSGRGRFVTGRVDGAQTSQS